MGKRVLLTGATGFIGSHLAEKLVKCDFDVLCVVRKTSDISHLKTLKLTIKEGNLSDANSIKKVLDGVDIIIHNAGITKAKKIEEYFRVNFDCTKNLLESAREILPDLERFIYIGSQAGVGPSPSEKPIDETFPPKPITPYGMSKLEGEKITMEYSKAFPVTVIRPTAVFGPREKDIYFYFKVINKRLMPFLGSFDPLISLVYVKDLVESIVLSATHPDAVNQIFFVSDNRQYKWSSVAEKIASALKRRCLRFRIPFLILKGAAYISEFTAFLQNKPALLNRYKIRELCNPYWVCSSEKITNLLGFKSQWDIDRAIIETAEWYKENKWL